VPGDAVVGGSAFLYVVVQSLGAMVGAAILLALLPGNSSNSTLCTPKPASGISLGQLFGYELIITFVLVLAVFASCDTNREMGGSGPLAIGLAIAMCHLWAVRIYSIQYTAQTTDVL